MTGSARVAIAAALWTLLLAQARPFEAAAPAPSVDGTRLMRHIETLASDEFEGRLPGTKGEDLTVAYLEEQFRKAGLQPGNTDGTYVQRVPLVGITAAPDANLTLRKGARTRVLKFRDEVVPWTKRVTERVTVDNSELVFVGYGVQAPEFEWDDYKGLDVTRQDARRAHQRPAVPDPKDPSRLDPDGVRRQGDDVLRPLDVQVRDRREARRRRRHRRPRDRAGGLPVLGGAEQRGRALRSRDAGREHVARGARELDLARGRRRAVQDGRPGLRRAQAAGVTREFQPVPLGVTASITIDNTCGGSTRAT
jgi:hypothetical protein